jgi:hypothetical protein
MLSDDREGIATRFLVANADLDLGTDKVSFDLHEEGGRIVLVIRVEEDTTLRAIQEGWFLVEEWRRRLLRHQGRWVMGGTGGFYQSLMERHESGVSYQRLADRVNRRLAELLRQAVEYRKTHKAAENQIRGMTNLEYWRWLAENDPEGWAYAGWHADDLLKDCRPRMSSEERKEMLLAGVANIDAGGEPFEKDWPVCREDVRERVRYWRAKVEAEQGGVEKTSAETPPVEKRQREKP